jgi:hypothetical protein
MGKAVLRLPSRFGPLSYSPHMGGWRESNPRLPILKVDNPLTFGSYQITAKPYSQGAEAVWINWRTSGHFQR